MAVRHRRDQACARQAPAIAAGHVGRGAGLVQKNEARGIHVALPAAPPPALGGDVGPVLLGRPHISLIAADGLTAKRRAAARIELPPSIACTIRRRRSKEIGAGMTTSRLSQPILSNHSC